MHRMIAGKRQAGKDNLRRPVWYDGIRRQGIADDLVILFGVKGAVVEGNARAARGTLRNSVTEALDHIGAARALRVLERHQKAARWWRVIMVIAAAPGVDVERAIGRDDHM